MVIMSPYDQNGAVLNFVALTHMSRSCWRDDEPTTFGGVLSTRKFPGSCIGGVLYVQEISRKFRSGSNLSLVKSSLIYVN